MRRLSAWLVSGPSPEARALHEAASLRPEGDRRRRLAIEIILVLGVSLLPSTLRSIVTLINRLTITTPLGQQTATINQSADARELFDLLYQLIAVAAGLVPVALALYLLWGDRQDPFRRIGFDLRRPGRDLGHGFALAAVIGLPGILLYVIGRALDFTATVQPNALDEYWWTAPVLILYAARAGLLEEVLGVGYLFTRLRELAWSPLAILFAAGLLRGSYHLYQGIGPFFGNLVMGLVFGAYFLRTGRVMPLVIAHTLLDVVVFLGYAWVAGLFPGWFGLAG